MRTAIACMLIAIPWSALALPGAVRADVADAAELRPSGMSTMRFLGIKVYDIRLWTAMRPFRHDELFALELTYDLSLKGAAIANRSVEEMRKQGLGDETKLRRWGEAMTRVFPDVKPGDTLIGISIPGKEARFYTRDRFIAAIPDPEFAKTFFDIWLSEKTSEPRLRAGLLGTP